MRFDTLAHMTGGTLFNPAFATQMFSGVTIDSRSVAKGNLFIAIRGERVDGHEYIAQAMAQGAAGTMIEKALASSLTIEAPAVGVEDTHEAMMQLARQYRDQLPATFIGITGSNGKTTTKEFTGQLIRAVEPNVFYSKGNLNNLYGMPLSMFTIPEMTKVAVMEMGISKPGEMSRLTQIIAPDVAVFTNIAPSHLEYLGSVGGVAKEKLEMIRLASPDVLVIVNADDSVLMRHIHAYHSNPITFGFTEQAIIHPEKYEVLNDGTSRLTIDGCQFHVPLLGKHFAYNLLAAYAVAKTLGYSFADVDTSGIQFSTAPMRGQSLHLNGITFIADCYNSNPQSLKAGLEAFAAVKVSGRKILVIGDMLELGNDEEQFHRQIGQSLSSYPCDAIIFVGPLSRMIGESAMADGLSAQRIQFYADAASCASAIRQFLKVDDIVYLKASRGIGLEAILKQFGYSEEKR